MSNNGRHSKKNKPANTRSQNTNRTKRLGIIAAAVFAGLIIIAAGYYGYVYASTPAHIRYPEYEHYHFRTQIIVGGEPVDFSDDRFQQEYDSSTCSAELTGQPIDFHDNEDQMTHVHWNGITGGELLKYYGWNFIGGDDSSLGRRFDQGMMRMHNVGIFGDHLPDIPEGASFYVYTGDENGYERKDWQEFLNTDLEELFGVSSNLNTDGELSVRSLPDLLWPPAYAHGGIEDEHMSTEPDGDEEERLTRINNLIGNIVIFVQESEPTEGQVQARFNKLVPLHESACGG